MDKLKMIIADPSDDFRTALSDALVGKFHIEICQDGPETLQALHTFHPDILVIDLMLPGVDGISLLQAAADNSELPAVMVTTRYISDYILDSLEQLGVAYLMTKPCDIKSTADRIRDIAQHLSAGPENHTAPRAISSNMLLNLGVPTKLHGYAYLREAVVLRAADPNQSITKELYPAVAAKYGATSAQVERSIRSAISAAWKNRDAPAWQQYFPCPDGSVIRPTNSAFISRLADALLCSRESGRPE